MLNIYYTAKQTNIKFYYIDSNQEKKMKMKETKI